MYTFSFIGHLSLVSSMQTLTLGTSFSFFNHLKIHFFQVGIQLSLILERFSYFVDINEMKYNFFTIGHLPLDLSMQLGINICPLELVYNKIGILPYLLFDISLSLRI